MTDANAKTSNLPRVSTIKKVQADPRRVYWAEKDRERLKKSEFEAMRYLLTAASNIAIALGSLGDRLECVPGGTRRMRMLVGACRAITMDILGTVPEKQMTQLQNTMRDFKIQLVPQVTHEPTQNVVIETGIAQGLVDIAQKQCTDCVEDDESCRKCELYMLLEGIIPLEDYRGMLCPYNMREWNGGKIPVRGR